MRLNSRIKLTIYKDDKIIIENYQELKDINDEEIVVDLYRIKGTFLKIKKMDNYMIEITGTLSAINII